MKVKKTGRKALSLLIAVMMLVSLVPLGTFTTSALSGSGTSSSPYLIYTADDLRDFRDKVNDGETTACAKLMNNIEFNTGTTYNANGYEGENPEEWEPIGATMGKKYKGTFDGNDCYVKGLYNKSKWTNEIGFFGYTTTGAVVKNLTIKDSFIWGDKFVGAFIGKATETTVLNCHNQNTYVKSDDKLGGVIGAAYSCTVTGCSNSGQVIANAQLCEVGGIIGYLDRSTISCCSNSGTIDTYDAYICGGIVGYSDFYCKYSDCISAGTVLDNEKTINSFIGTIGKDSQAFIYNSFSNGEYIRSMNFLLFLSECGVYIEDSFYTADTIYPPGSSKSQFEEHSWIYNVNCATDSMLASGEVAYKLNQTSTSASWGQTIGTDSYPLLNGQKVYYGYENCQSTEKTYSNDVRYDTISEAHIYSPQTGICTVCGVQGGTALDPYPISNADDLTAFANAVNNGSTGLCGFLTDDINLNPDITFNTNDGTYSGGTPTDWTPIGSDSDNAFSGFFDGNGHTISGLYSTQGGLFNYLRGARIDDLNITDSVVSSTDEYVGLMAGQNSIMSGAEFTDCNVSGYLSASSSTEGAGGFLGYDKYSSFSNCNASVVINSSNSSASLGGFVGFSSRQAYFNNCSNSSTISGGFYDGGFIGKSGNDFETTSETWYFKNCCNNGTVKAISRAGGFIGKAYENSDVSFKNCYNAGEISCSCSGQIVGEMKTYDTSSVFSDIYITDSGYDAVGRLNSEIEISPSFFTSEQLKNGELTYSLNGSTSEGTLVWGQELGVDSTPVLGGKTVYYGTNCAGVSSYSNEPVTSDHDFASADGKCTVCGAYEDGMSALYGRSITLDGNVKLNFIMELDDACANENTTMNFTVFNYDYETFEEVELYTQSVPFADAEKVTVDGKTYYKFTCSLASKEMTCFVKAQIMNGENEGREFYYNVEEYAYNLLNDESVDTKTKELVISMLNYGANSQAYFDFNIYYLANYNLPGSLTQLDDTQADELSAYKSSYTPDESYTGSASYYGSSLVLKSGTEIKHYFAYDSSKTSIDNFTCTDSNGNSYEIAESGSYLYVKVDNIPAHQLGETVTLSLYENGEKVGEISYSPLSYAYSVLSAYPTDDGTHDNARNLVKSLYQYNNKAVEYKAA